MGHYVYITRSECCGKECQYSPRNVAKWLALYANDRRDCVLAALAESPKTAQHILDHDDSALPDDLNRPCEDSPGSPHGSRIPDSALNYICVRVDIERALRAGYSTPRAISRFLCPMSA